MNIIEKNTKKLARMLVKNELKNIIYITKEELYTINQDILNDRIKNINTNNLKN